MPTTNPRIFTSVVYVVLGTILFKFAYFTPWYPFCWGWYASLLGWAVAGIVFDPFRFLAVEVAPDTKPNAAVRLVRRGPVAFLSLLVISPLIAWVTQSWWFFPWLPWWSLAWYWIAREVILSTLFAIFARIIWSTLATGRQYCILLSFLITSHLVLLLTYAAISGDPDYLGDGSTQDCFLMQLWFKIGFGTFAFFALEFRKRWKQNRYNIAPKLIAAAS